MEMIISSREATRIQRKYLKDLGKSTRASILKTLTDTAREARLYAQRELPHHVDKPTAYTLRSIQYQKSDKATQSAWVGFAGKGFGKLPANRKAGESPAEYMQRQMQGGTREADLYSLIVPTTKQAKTKQGNIKKNFYNNARTNKEKFFIGRPKGRSGSEAKEGIYKRLGKGGRKSIQLQAVFKSSVKTPRGTFSLRRVVDRTVKLYFPIHFEENLKKSMAQKQGKK